MLGFELTRDNRGKRGPLAAVVTEGYLALLGLRTQFLAAVAGDSFSAAFLPSAMLTAISAGLVWFGSVVLARTRFLGYSRAQAAARRASQAAAQARAAQLLAAETLQRHIGSLHHFLFAWALSSSRRRSACPLSRVSTTPSGPPRLTVPSMSCSRPRDRLWSAAPGCFLRIMSPRARVQLTRERCLAGRAHDSSRRHPLSERSPRRCSPRRLPSSRTVRSEHGNSPN